MESMRVKPAGTGNLDKLESMPVVRGAWRAAEPPFTQIGDDT